jgi:hypothetical protein
MTFQPPSTGTFSKFGIDTANPTTHQLEYTTFGLKKHRTVLSTDGIRGTRSHPVERTRDGTYTCSGAIAMNPGPAALDILLPFITGSAKSVNTFALAESLTAQTAFIQIDRVAKVHTYAGCQVNKATFKASQGGLLEVSIDWEALTETPGNAGTFPALTADVDIPYVLMDAVVTIGGLTVQFREFELVIDNHLKLDRFMNSVSRTDLPALDRTVEVTLSLPYTSDTAALYDTNATPAHVVATFTNGADSLALDMVAVQFPTESPDTPGRDEILLPYKGTARKSGATSELVITNVST